MKPSALRILFVSIFIALAFFPSSAKAQDRSDVILPAGTLLRCTLNEPNFSSKTADVGDPVICNLSAVAVFGRPAFPRGAYLGGHLEADKDPGHFVGKGYLQLEFDHIGTADGRLPVPAKIIALRGYKVGKDGKIIGHGHPTRDAVGWMIPPLWPVKVLTLPGRGPRPTLKGEESLTLRLMDDIAIPAPPLAQARYPSKPSAEYMPNRTYAVPNRYFPARAPLPPKPDSVNRPQEQAAPVARAASAPGGPSGSASARQNVLVLRNGVRYVATNVHVDSSNRLSYMLADGTAGTARLEDVDWTKTFQGNAEGGAALTLSSANSER
jgi:hypothetical protein